MSYIDWDSSLETGIGIIDTQHRQIVDYINRLHVAIERNDRSAIGEILDQAVNYTLTHFSFEEKMMEQAGYPHLEAHRTVHQSFTHRIQEYRLRRARGEDVGKRLMADLRIWLTNHIKNDDRDYAQSVKAQLQGEKTHRWLPKALSAFFSR